WRGALRRPRAAFASLMAIRGGRSAAFIPMGCTRPKSTATRAIPVFQQSLKETRSGLPVTRRSGLESGLCSPAPHAKTPGENSRVAVLSADHIARRGDQDRSAGSVIFRTTRAHPPFGRPNADSLPAKTSRAEKHPPSLAIHPHYLSQFDSEEQSLPPSIPVRPFRSCCGLARRWP